MTKKVWGCMLQISSIALFWGSLGPDHSAKSGVIRWTENPESQAQRRGQDDK
jgi:hypothetical protein